VRACGVAARQWAAAFVALLGVLVLTLLTAASARAAVPVQARGLLQPLRVNTGKAMLDTPGGLLRLVREQAGDVPQARPAIVGGSETSISIEQTPWHVEVFGFVVNGSTIEGVYECGGSIIDATHVVTAGHCVYNEKEDQRIPTGDVVVVAGSSNFQIEELGEQDSAASSVRVDPKYDYNPGATTAVPDDVAVVELKKAIVFGKRAQPIALAAPGSSLQVGTSLNLSGGGQENTSSEPNGKLYALTTTLEFSGLCGEQADALFLCASTPSGSLCFGDSGSGLTLPGVTVSLVGIADFVEVIDGKACLHGSGNGFVNVTAPEVQDFIKGVAEPEAPRGDPTATIAGAAVVGDSLTCGHGSWTGSPAYSYSFINSAGGEVLQTGSSAAYLLTSADLGRTILCEVLATNAGGTGVGRSVELNPVVLPPPPEVTSLTPSEGPLSGGNVVVIKGSRFAPTSTVSFGATAAAGVIVDSETEISATVPASLTAGRVDVRVTVGGPSPKVAADEYDYVLTPTIWSLTPAEGPEAGNTVITIGGSEFTGATAVSFGGSPAASFKVTPAGSITATAPAGKGTVAVTVRSSSGLSAETPADLYTYDSVPTVGTVSPNSGPVAGGTETTIIGTGFTRAAKVRFGTDIARTVTYVSGTQLTAESPAGTGAVNVTVETLGGTSVESAADVFTYEASANVTKGSIGGHQEEGDTGLQNGQEPVARSSVRATGTKLSISGDNAVVDLSCSGAAACSGKLTLTAKRTIKEHGKTKVTIVDIGTAEFSIAGDGHSKVKIKLSPFGRAQVRATHGHLPAVLQILGHETEPTHKHDQDVTIL
jgi:hypothetical protein